MAYSQGDIVEHDVEPRCSPNQVVADQPRDILTLCDELTGIELRHHALQNLVHNRRQHPLVVVRS
jgi:hypothetical protein